MVTAVTKANTPVITAAFTSPMWANREAALDAAAEILAARITSGMGGCTEFAAVVVSIWDVVGQFLGSRQLQRQRKMSSLLGGPRRYSREVSNFLKCLAAIFGLSICRDDQP